MTAHRRTRKATLEARLGAVDWLQSANRPFWRESLATVEWLSLRGSRVYRGEGTPRGDGSAVITIPGFLAHDATMTEMRRWLRRTGYRAVASGVGRNAACPRFTVGQVVRTIDENYARTGRPVHLVGHSLGGVLGRAAAAKRPGRVASVTTLGSPIQGPRMLPVLLRVASVVLPECVRGLCSCIEMLDSVNNPLPASVASLAFHSKTDGILDWRCCVNTDPASHNTEVRGSHCGLPFNTRVYEVFASFLADLRRVRLIASDGVTVNKLAA